MSSDASTSGSNLRASCAVDNDTRQTPILTQASASPEASNPTNTSTADLSGPAQLPTNIQLPEISRQLQDVRSQMDSNYAVLQRLLLMAQSTEPGAESNLVNVINGLRNDIQALSQAIMFASVNKSPKRTYQSTIAPATQTATTNSAPLTESYALSRNTASVVDLWREWFVSLRPNAPSVVELNNKYRCAWRKETKERQFYSRRLAIINEIREIATSESCSLEEAARTLEQRRVAKGWSLNQLTRELRNK